MKITHRSACSLHSTSLAACSTTVVWNFSFPRAIVTKASFVSFLPFALRPLARRTANQKILGYESTDRTLYLGVCRAPHRPPQLWTWEASDMQDWPSCAGQGRL